MATELRTLQGFVSRAFTSNSTEGAFQAITATVTAPSAGVLALPANESNGEVTIVPYGTDETDEAFQIRVVGWHRIGGLYVPIDLATVACTMGDGTAKGVAGQAITASEFFCDVLTLQSGSSSVDVRSPGAGTEEIGWFKCKTKGVAVVQIQASVTTAASANAIVGVT